MNKAFYILSCLTILSALSLISLFSFWYLYPYKPIEFMTEPHKILEQEVKPGGHVNFTLDYCKYEKIGAELTVSFVDGFIYNTTPIPSNMEIGCHSVDQSVYVPKALPYGTYSVKILYRYKVNPVRTIDIITTSEKFQVVK